MQSGVFRFFLRILGPALLGVGTIFQAKARPSDHWSTSPRFVISVESSPVDSGDPARDAPGRECAPSDPPVPAFA